MKLMYCTFENTKQVEQKKTQTHHTPNKTKCIHKHDNMAAKQSTLFGELAKATIYYKQEAKTRFEKFIEAFYYFNKNGKTKEQVYKLAVKEWGRIKEGDEVEKLLSKHNEERKKETTVLKLEKVKKVVSFSNVQ